MRGASRMEVALAVVLAVVGELEIWLADVSGPRAVAATAALLSPILLVWRRRAPLAVAVACTVIVTAQFLLGVDTTGPSVWMLVLVVAVYALGERETSRRAMAGGAFALACLWIFVLTRPVIDPTDFTFAALLIVAPLVLGRLLGASRREAVAAAEGARAERELAMREAVIAERSRIARELHDIVSHSISVMGIQAGVARRLLTPDQDDARTSLLSVEATGRQALNEMRRLLGILRDQQGPLALAPQPGLRDLHELAAEARAAGHPVELRVDDGSGPLAPGVELAAYRIVQEALTNVRKHAASAPATVTVERIGDRLQVEVRDIGPGSRSAVVGGHGILGMRERVALYGGELEVLSPPAGGHVVRARLPARDGTR